MSNKNSKSRFNKKHGVYYWEEVYPEVGDIVFAPRPNYKDETDDTFSYDKVVRPFLCIHKCKGSQDFFVVALTSSDSTKEYNTDFRLSNDKYKNLRINNRIKTTNIYKIKRYDMINTLDTLDARDLKIIKKKLIHNYAVGKTKEWESDFFGQFYQQYREENPAKVADCIHLYSSINNFNNHNYVITKTCNDLHVVMPYDKEEKSSQDVCFINVDGYNYIHTNEQKAISNNDIFTIYDMHLKEDAMSEIELKRTR